MARHFNGSTDKLVVAIGTIGALTTGSLAYIIRKTVNEVTVQVPAAVGDVDANSFYGYFDNGVSNNVGFWNGSADATNLTGFLAAVDDYALVMFTKSTGTSMVRVHKYVYGTTTWTHTDMSTLANSPAPSGHVTFGQLPGGSGGFQGDIEIAGIASTAPADATIEASGIATNYTAWQSMFGVALWPFNQASIATAVTDTTGHGADQTSITGTTTATGPAAFSYAAAPTTIVSPVQTFGSSYAATRAASI